jgi:hypothetical protein
MTAARQRAMTRQALKIAVKRTRDAERASKVRGVPVEQVDDKALFLAGALETWQKLSGAGTESPRKVPGAEGDDAA